MAVVHLAALQGRARTDVTASDRAGRRPIDELFGALADPTRRDLLERLLHGGPATATELAAAYPLTRQAIVKHLQALSAAGLVASAREGREVRYRATTEPLAAVIDWLRGTSAAWDHRATRLRHTSRPKPVGSHDANDRGQTQTGPSPQRRAVTPE